MNNFNYIYLLVAAFLLALILTPIVYGLALKLKAVDKPSRRRINTKTVPRMGGLAIVGAFVIMALFSMPLDTRMQGFLLATLVLMVFAVWDDILDLPPWMQFLGQSLVAVIVILYGMGVSEIRNPFGHDLVFGGPKLDLSILGFDRTVGLLEAIVTYIWIVGMINVVNFLDGLDGLATGVSAIAALTLFALSLSVIVFQPVTAALAIMLTGAALGFLPYNFNPARIYLGSTGSWFLGFSLATLSIISGGKVATAILVLGFPILDGMWVACRRLAQKKSPFKGDLSHLHHRLLSVGLSPRRVVFLIYVLCAGFGVAALMSETERKFWALIVLVITMIVISGLIWFLQRIRRVESK